MEPTPQTHPADMPGCTTKRPIGFTSKQEWRVYDHYYSNRYVIGVGNGTSLISQQDADDKAMIEAKADAAKRAKNLSAPIGASNLYGKK